MSEPLDKFKERTDICLKKIVGTEELSPVVLFVGKVGVGKSSMIECITGVTGMSDTSINSVTTKCQLVSGQFHEREYFFMDTPGFEDADTASDIFIKIAEMIDGIRGSITVVGVWYIVDNSVQGNSRFDQKLLKWLAAFCGEEYYPYVTFVTTHWGCTHPEELEVLQGKFDQRKRIWEGILTERIETYQLGKKYNRNGVETSEVPTLSWYNDISTLRENAQELVRRRCQVQHEVEPRIIRDLNKYKAIEKTAAAKVFRPPTKTPTPPPEEETDDETPPEPNWFIKMINWFLNNVKVDINGNRDGINGEIGVRQFRANFDLPPSATWSHMPRITNTHRVNGNWDQNSVVDTFKSHGMSSRLEDRIEWGRQHGFTSSFRPGSMEYNMEMIRAFKEIHNND